MSIFSFADSRSEQIRKSVSDSILEKRAASGGTFFSSGSASSNRSGSEMFASQAGHGLEQSKALRQYQSFKNTVSTALRPIIVRFASQPIRVGVTASKRELESNRSLGGLISKFFSPESEKIVRESAPSWIKANVGSGVTPLESHPILDLLASPNEFMTTNGLLQCTAASYCLTGRACWWFDSSGDPREETGLSTRIWYIPVHWIRPSGPSTNPFSKFKIQMPSSGEIEVDGNDIFYSMIPHPEDPSRAWSAVQGQAASIDTDEQILLAQYTSMKNVIRPSLIITAGRVNGMPGGVAGGKGPRVSLNRESRMALTEAIKGHYQGVMKYNEPLILDAMIEDVRPLIAGPVELDLLNSSEVTQSRIFEGVGVSPVVAGYSENANRAGSVVAHEIFYELVLNPLINLFGQSLAAMAKRRYGSYSTGSKRSTLTLWMDEAKPKDAENLQQRVEQCIDALTVGEVREYLRTGTLVMEEKTAKDGVFYKDFKSEQSAIAQSESEESAKKEAKDKQDKLEMESKEKSFLIKSMEDAATQKSDNDSLILAALAAIASRPMEVTIKQDPTEITINQEPAEITINQEPTEISIKQESQTITINSEPAEITIKQDTPVVNITSPEIRVDVPPPSVVVQAQEPPIVNVAAPVVNVESPTVNVEQPTINVAAPNVSVAAPIVNVEPNINVQPEKSRTARVERDQNGRITGLVTE